MNTNTQPKTGQPCTCKPGRERDNCPNCEGTGWRIDFQAIRGDCQAEEFLERHGIKARITLSNSKPAPWVPAGNHYRVTLYAGVALTYDNPLRRLVFDFWGSAHDADEHKHPSTYQILSCIGSDIHTPDTFEDYCAEYGESADSLKALQTFRKCARFARRLREFFTESERKELAEIR